MFALSAFWSSPAVAATLAVIHLTLALIVTIDVLLKKSDVRGALGWIGAVWFAPILGSILYYLFGINRVTRRALKLGLQHQYQATLPDPVAPKASQHIGLLSQVSARVTQRPLIGGNLFTVLETGDQAYPQMLSAIASAQQCVAMSSYIFRNDEAGMAFADALIAARQRGVEVRVLLDSIGSGYIYPEIFYRMRRGGVKAARFLHTWLPWRMPFLNMRNHRKILVCDGKLAFVGGINIDANNCTRPAQARRIRDVHFRVEGPIVREIMDVFAQDWTFTTEELLNQKCWWPELTPMGTSCARGLRSGPDADLYRLEMILGAAISLARSRIRIVTPYFLPDPRLQFALQQAGLRGVTVEIVLPAQSDQPIMTWAMLGHLRFFRHVRATVVTTPAPFDHSKLCTIDGEWSLIGSSNWDVRSFRLNFEFDLEVTDQLFTKTLDALIDQRIEIGTSLTPDMLAAEPLWKRLRNALCRLLMPYL